MKMAMTALPRLLSRGFEFGLQRIGERYQDRHIIDRNFGTVSRLLEPLSEILLLNLTPRGM
jgi:hypothetical protein